MPKWKFQKTIRDQQGVRFAIVQNKFQQTNKNKINHIIGNHIKFEVSLQVLGIWPTVWRATRGTKIITKTLRHRLAPIGMV